MRRALLALSLALTACSKDAPPVAEEPRTAAAAKPEAPAPGPEAPGEPAPSAPQPAAATVKEASFELTLSASGAAAPGKRAELTLVLVSHPPFKVNQEYPFKLQLAEAEGVQFDENPVTKARVRLEKEKATMTIGFTPAGPGTKTIAGKFSFSVCTEDKCLIEKRDVALDVEVR